MQLNLPLPPAGTAGDPRALWSYLYQLTERLNTFRFPDGVLTLPAERSSGGGTALSDLPDAALTADDGVAATPAALATVEAALRQTDAAQAARLTDLEDAGAVQDDRLTALEEADAAQDEKLTALEESDAAQDDTLSALSSTTSSHTTAINNLQTKQASHTTDISSLKTKQATHTSQISALQGRATAIFGTGTISYGSSYNSATVSFGKTFKTAPTVLVAQVFDDANLVVKTTDITTTKFTVGLPGVFSSSGTRAFSWVAVGNLS